MVRKKPKTLPMPSPILPRNLHFFFTLNQLTLCGILTLISFVFFRRYTASAHRSTIDASTFFAVVSTAATLFNSLMVLLYAFLFVFCNIYRLFHSELSSMFTIFFSFLEMTSSLCQFIVWGTRGEQCSRREVTPRNEHAFYCFSFLFHSHS